MTSANPLFIDTNVLVYANIAESPWHKQALNAIKVAHQAGRPLWISRQVLREFIATRTRPQTFAQPSTPDVLVERIRYLEKRFQIADETTSVTRQLIKLLRDFEIAGKQIHDANIVATMQAYGIPCLLTHNIKDFRRFGKIIQMEEIEPPYSGS